MYRNHSHNNHMYLIFAQSPIPKDSDHRSRPLRRDNEKTERGVDHLERQTMPRTMIQAF